MSKKGLKERSNWYTFSAIFIGILIVFLVSTNANITGFAISDTGAYEDGLIEEVQQEQSISETSNVSEGIDIEVKTAQYGAVLGSPVKWRKNITLSEPSSITIQLPEETINYSIIGIQINNITLNETITNITSNQTIESNLTINETISNQTSVNLTNQSNSNSLNQTNTTSTENQTIISNSTNQSSQGSSSSGSSGISAQVNSTLTNQTQSTNNTSVNSSNTQPEPVNETIIELESQVVEEENTTEVTEEPSQEDIESEEIVIGITGEVVRSIKETSFPFASFFQGLVRFVGFVTLGENNFTQEVVIEEEVTQVEVEYFTEAPYAIETETSEGKTVEIIGPDNLHYENVLAFTELNEELGITSKDLLQIYWEQNQTYLDFEIYDLDENNIYDYIEWVVPHLSNQTFNIIVITDAQHLDVNRSFISNIYNEVHTLDGNWSETINDQEYVRITFERNLTSVNDITIYPRIVNGTPRIEIYEFNDPQIIAEFNSINNENYNQIILSGLNDEQDTFDLRIFDGSIEFDHIIDPTDGSPEIDFVSPTPANGSTQSSSSIFVNVSSNDTSDHYTFVDFDNSLIGWWRMDSANSTTVFDESPYSVNGTFTGNALINNTGNFGNATWMDGTGDSISLGSFTKLLGLNQFTVSAWALDRTNGSSGGEIISMEGSGTADVFALYTSTQPKFGVTNSTGTTSTAQYNNIHIGYNWHHYVGTWNGSSVTIYFDGSQGTTQNLSGFTNQTFGNTLLYIGGRITGFGATWNGSIDEVLIFNRTLSAGEISSLYNASANKYQNNFTNLVQGTHIFKGYAVDTQGNKNQTEQRSTAIDFSLIPPISTLISPTNGTISIIDTHSFQANFSDETGLANSTFYIWNSTNFLLNQTTQTISGLTNLSNLSVTLPYNGTFFWNYLVTDSLNNKAFATSNYTFIYNTSADVTPPLVTVNFPIDGATYRNLPHNLSFNVTLSETGFVRYSLTNGSFNYTMTGNEGVLGTSFNYTNNSIADGTYVFKVYANDSTGNNNFTHSVTFTINTSYGNATSLNQFGITWTFNQSITYGRFANGDYWVVGPVNITSVSPAIGSSPGRNGSMINPIPGRRQAYDERAEFWNSSLLITFPRIINGNSSLVSTISLADSDLNGNSSCYVDVTGTCVDDSRYLKAAAVLTIMDTNITPNLYCRPPFNGNLKPLYDCSSFNSTYIRNLANTSALPESGNYTYFLRTLERPWLNHLFDYLDLRIQPVLNMPSYYQFIAMFYSDVSVLLLTNTSSIANQSDKDLLLLRYVQNGIDLYHAVQYPEGASSLNVWPIIYTGLLLDEPAIYNYFITNKSLIEQAYYNTSIGLTPFREFWQTYYVNQTSYNSSFTFGYGSNFANRSLIVPEDQGWTGARVLWRQDPLSEHEQLYPTEWIFRSPSTTDHPWGNSREGYRQCCTGRNWPGFVLSAKILNVTSLINHPAYVDYAERWMVENATYYASKYYSAVDYRPFQFTNSSGGLQNYTNYSLAVYSGTTTSTSSSFVYSMWHNYYGFSDTVSPAITLNSPANGSSTTNSSFLFNATFRDYIRLKNATFYLWNSSNAIVNQSVISLSGIDNNSALNVTLPYTGIFKWNYLAYDNSSNYAMAFRNYTVEYLDNGPDTTPPTVTLVAPINGSSLTNRTISFNATFSDNIQLRNATLYVWNSTHSIVNQTNRSISGTVNSVNITVNLPYEGTFRWNYLTSDNSSNSAFASSNYTLTYSGLDSINPNVTSLTENPSDPVTYSTGGSYEFNASITDNVGIATTLLQFNGINYTAQNISLSRYNVTLTDLAAGIYTYTWIVNDTSGNINNSESGTYTINNATGNVTLLINGTAGNQTIVYGAQTNASGSTLYGSVTLYRNNIVVNNNEPVVLGVGDWNFTAVSSGDQNHSAATITRWTHISQATPSLNLTLNVIQNNVTVLVNNSFMINGTLLTGDSGGILRLYQNGTLINQGTREVSNLTSIGTMGLYNITVIYVSSQNYTQFSQTYYVNVTVDTTSPEVTINLPTATTYSTSTLNFNVSLNENGSIQFSLDNGVTNYSMSTVDSENFNYSFSSLDGSYTFRVYANDSSGNRNDTETVNFTVSVSSPGSSGGSSGGGGGGGGGGAAGVTATSNYWVNTYESELEEKEFVRTSLISRERTKVEVDGEEHHVGIVNITSTTATVNVSSTPQQKVFAIGESYKFDVNDDEYYDLLITLEDIIALKAYLLIENINEYYGSGSEQNNNDEGTVTQPSEKEFKTYYYYILLGVTLLVIVIVFFIIRRRTHKYHRR